MNTNNPLLCTAKDGILQFALCRLVMITTSFRLFVELQSWKEVVFDEHALVFGVNNFYNTKVFYNSII